jgi:hypothetical protein
LLVLESNPISVIKKTNSTSDVNYVRERALDITLEPGSGLPTEETTQTTAASSASFEQTFSTDESLTASFIETSTNLVDFCSLNSNPCPINSTCVSLANNFTCNCNTGFNFNFVIIKFLFQNMNN